jgi:hypothetical protein
MARNSRSFLATSEIRRRILSDGYFLTTDGDLLGEECGVGSNCIEAFSGDLRRDYVTFHPDRQRLRNVYEITCRNGSDLTFTEAESIFIENRNIGGKRDYTRADFLSVKNFELLLSSLFFTIPKSDRDGVNLIEVDYMRTRKTVTNTIHRDFRKYVSIYCLQKRGRGAKTYLYFDPKGKETAFNHTLSPGDVLMFRDEDFYHFTTDLQQEPEDTLRDVFIIIFGD